MANIVTGEEYMAVDGQLHEIKRQLRQPNGYPFDLAGLKRGLQTLIEGKEIVVKAVGGIVGALIFRIVKVNRARSPQDALDATGRKQYTDRSVVDAMPKGEGDKAEVVFFKPDLSERDGFITDDDLEKEYELRGLIPADPYSLAAVNEADPAFADEKPNATHWKDAQGKWCCAVFSRWHGERGVLVRRDDSDWRGYWWFAGIRR